MFDPSFLFQTGELNPAMASLNLKGCMVIPDDFEGYPKDLFMIPKHYESSVESVLIPGGVIQVSIFTSTMKPVYPNFARL